MIYQTTCLNIVTGWSQKYLQYQVASKLEKRIARCIDSWEYLFSTKETIKDKGAGALAAAD